jgi:23S rRNA pseudouridine1911/1915/1917 synthase
MRTEIQEKSTLLEVLQRLSPDSSKNTLRSWVEQGRVLVDDKQITSWRHILQPGQLVKVGPKVFFADEGIRVLYEDSHLIVIDKPEKLLSVASLDETESNVHAILRRRLKKRVFPVHRLDKDTSGVLVFAYTEVARDGLKEQFADHSIERVYYAFVEGTLTPPKGTWKSYLVEDESYFVKSSKTGKLAITHYQVMNAKRGISLVKFQLETGRKNQIRVHASEAGHPVVGDTKYGGQSRRVRLCLHAHILAFNHPVKKKRIRFVSPLPELFSQENFK